MHKACVWCGAFVYCLQVPLFPEPGQWVWCVNIQTGSTPTKTIPDASEKDATSQNQTQACAKKTHRTHPCASSLTMPKATECFCWNDLSEVNTKRTKKNVDYSGFRCNCLEIDVLKGTTNDRCSQRPWPIGPRATLSYDDSLLTTKNARIHVNLMKRTYELHESAINSKKRLQCQLFFRRM